MADARKPEESSVMVSLTELMRMEQRRVDDEAKDKTEKVLAERRREAELKIQEQAAQAAELERQRAAAHQKVLEQQMFEAQLAASTEAEIQRARLAEEHRLRMESDNRHRAHEEAMAQIAATRRKGVSPAWIAGALVLLIGAGSAVTYVTVIKPKAEAKAAVAEAEGLLNQGPNDPTNVPLDLIERRLGVAHALDPETPGLKALEAKVRGLRDTLAAAEVARRLADKTTIESLKAERERIERDLKKARESRDQAAIDALERELALADGKKILSKAPKAIPTRPKAETTPKGEIKSDCVKCRGIPMCACGPGDL